MAKIATSYSPLDDIAIVVVNDGSFTISGADLSQLYKALMRLECRRDRARDDIRATMIAAWNARDPIEDHA